MSAQTRKISGEELRMTPFHAGEIEVQARAGVRAMAERVGRSIGNVMPDAAQAFLLEQRFVVVGAATGERVWASILTGPAGFAHALSPSTLRIEAAPAPGDALHAAWQEQAPLGLLAIEPATRRRMRLNGTARQTEGALIVSAREVYANCPKYIVKRELRALEAASVPGTTQGTTARQSAQLSPGQTAFIERADTFFIASLAPNLAPMFRIAAARRALCAWKGRAFWLFPITRATRCSTPWAIWN